MRGGWVVLVWVSACDGSALSSTDGAVTSDVPLGPPLLCSNTEPLALELPVFGEPPPPRIQCTPTDGGFPANCVRPPGVHWVDPQLEGGMQTVTLPAGAYYEDPVAGCMWFVVWPEWGGRFRVETATLGCSMSLVVPQVFAEGGCGRTSYGGIGCTRFSIVPEACSTSGGRGVALSGTAVGLVDGIAGTLTTSGIVFDTSSAPHSCACE